MFSFKKPSELLTPLLSKLKEYSLLQFVLIGIVLIVLCAVLFPSRLASLVALPSRMFIATLFVYTLFWIDDDLDKTAKPWLICAGFLAAGFSL